MKVDQLRLGWRSHLLACRFGAEIVERDDCIVVRSPSNPTYCWGNCLILPTAPRDCGLVHDGRGGVGRFQFVETQVDWRRRGLCRALVHHVCMHAFEALQLQRLVTCADPHDVAIGIYRSIGFTQAESHWCLQRRPRRDRG